MMSRWLTATDFGAKGDGIADDSAAVQYALNVAETIKGSVFFPAGFYRMNVTMPPCVEIFGERAPGRVEAFSGELQTFPGETRLIPSNPAQPVVRIPYLKGNAIRNLRFLGPGAYSTGSIGLDVRTASGQWAGTGLACEGVEFIHFDKGLFNISNRGRFDQCSFMSCNNGFYTDGTGGAPSDTLTFLNCSGGGARLTSPGVLETQGSRTGVGWHIGGGGVKGATFINCEMGQCGTALSIGRDYPYLSLHGCNFEANDTGAIKMESGALFLSACNSFSVDRPFIDVTFMGGTADVVTRACRVLTSYGSEIRTVQNRKPDCSPAMRVEYVGGFTRTVSSSGERMMIRMSGAGQSVTSGTTDLVVGFNEVLRGNPDHFNAATGEWRCPRSGTYRMRVRLAFSGLDANSWWYIAYADSAGGVTTGSPGLIIRKPSAVMSGEFQEGELEFNAFAGKFYRVMGQASDPSFSVLGNQDPITGGPVCHWSIEEVLSTD